MKSQSRVMLANVAQQWTSYGACRDDVVAAMIKLDAEKNTKALAKYIEELETKVPAK